MSKRSDAVVAEAENSRTLKEKYSSSEYRLDHSKGGY